MLDSQFLGKNAELVSMLFIVGATVVLVKLLLVRVLSSNDRYFDKPLWLHDTFTFSLLCIVCQHSPYKLLPFQGINIPAFILPLIKLVGPVFSLCFPVDEILGLVAGQAYI